MIDRCDTAVEDCGREALSKARPADWDADGPQGASVGAAGSTPRCVSVLGGVLLGGDLGGPPRPPLSSVERGASAIALDVHLEDCGVVDEAIDGGHRSGLVGEHLVPFSEGLVRGYQKSLLQNS